jgi:hypothetical protein
VWNTGLEKPTGFKRQDSDVGPGPDEIRVVQLTVDGPLVTLEWAGLKFSAIYLQGQEMKPSSIRTPSRGGRISAHPIPTQWGKQPQGELMGAGEINEAYGHDVRPIGLSMIS